MQTTQTRLRRRGERGQAISEYIVTVSAFFVVAAVCTYQFLSYVGEFYVNLVKMISLPLP
jgi:hypothetical protein